ncbi:MAG: DNA polymerase III subunit beta [Bacteroidaceae bacterium]|nr:DNA polymerase III subunit beta [Bacteroidaceae bacterium]MBP5322823.1 DNA polymerase III subunit beta [Bacteroidaceae bacterium]
MKFVVTSTELYARLQSIGRVINSKNALPILDCFLFSLDEGILSITASDNETTLDTSLQVIEYEGKGQFAISSKSILDAIKELPEQPVVFNVDLSNMNIVIEYMNGKFSMVGQNADEYPTTAVLGENVVKFSMGADVLLGGINRTLFATADDELRPVMNGIYFDINSESITLVASDGHKLVRYRLLDVQGTEKSAFILPKKPANILKNILGKEADDIEISFDNRNAVFTLPNHSMVCRLIEGRYPNYNSVIPANNPYKATINRQALLSALRRVSVFSSASSSLVKLRLQNNEVHISAQDIDFASSAEEKIVCQYNGEPMSIGFKSTFLIDIISNITGEDINIEVSDPSRAGVLIPTIQEENSDLLMLLMPMMLND